MNKDDIKDIIYRLILCFAIVLFLFLLLLIIYSILDTLKNKNENWISFWGAIIGGLLTLLGVWWTLNEQQKQFNKNLEEQKRISNNEILENNKRFQEELKQKEDELDFLKKQRKEDLTIQYKPFLKIYMSDYNFKNKKIIKKDNINCLNMTIKNIGRGEALECKMYNKLGHVFYSPNCLPAGIESDLPIPIPNKNDFCGSITLYMEYKDLFKANRYKLQLNISLEYKCCKIAHLETNIEYL